MAAQKSRIANLNYDSTSTNRPFKCEHQGLTTKPMSSSPHGFAELSYLDWWHGIIIKTYFPHEVCVHDKFLDNLWVTVRNIHACNLNRGHRHKELAVDLENVGSANCSILPQRARMYTRSRPGRCGEEKISWPCRDWNPESYVFQPVASRYTDWTILARLFMSNNNKLLLLLSVCSHLLKLVPQ
jgi:hypothetical protein